MLEEWRPVAGYLGAYEVSNLGRVRSLDRVIIFPTGRTRTARGRILKPGAVRRGHLYVNLGKGNSQYVHQIVAAAFLGPRPEGLEVCHNNGNPVDNNVANLRYDTHANNMRDMLIHGTHPQARKAECKNRHQFSAENTSYRAKGRVCLVCKRESTQSARKAGATW